MIICPAESALVYYYFSAITNAGMDQILSLRIQIIAQTLRGPFQAHLCQASSPLSSVFSYRTHISAAPDGGYILEAHRPGLGCFFHLILLHVYMLSNAFLL